MEVLGPHVCDPVPWLQAAEAAGGPVGVPNGFPFTVQRLELGPRVNGIFGLFLQHDADHARGWRKFRQRPPEFNGASQFGC